MTVQGSELLGITGKVLAQMGVSEPFDVKLITAKQKADEWLVNFSYKTGFSWYDSYGCFKVNIESGEVTGMWLGKTWQ